MPTGPRLGVAPQGDSPWRTGFTRMARQIGAALGDGTAVSPRTELFRPLPADPMAWLLHTFPTYFQNARGERVPLAPHHEAFWAWFWALRPGEAQRDFIAIWARGGGKSTGLELGAACAGYFGLRRYGLYICGVQKQADDHVANVGRLLELLGVERAINRYGFSRGWNINRLTTADGYTLDAIGLDAALRGVKRDEARPDMIFLDELDEQLDTIDTTTKKIDVLTRSILPTGANSLTVVGVQNLPNRDGIFAQLADGRAEFLLDRQISGPHPALRDLPLQDWYVRERRDDGTTHLALTQGTPVWAGQDLVDCQVLLNRIGPQAFLIECQHLIAHLGGTLFRREWFPIVSDWPRQASLVRYWDFAATEEPTGQRRRTKDPDWTVGLLMGLWRGQFWILDVQRVRRTPMGVKDLVRQTAAVDGRHVAIWLEEEGGASGKSVTEDYRRDVLVGYNVRVWHVTGSKGERVKPVSAAAEAGNVFLVRGLWTGAFLEEIGNWGLPGVHDDQVDALSGAHYALTQGQTTIPHDFSLAPALARMTQPGTMARAQTAAVLPAAVRGLWGLGEDDERWERP
jgi:predicted phage terminase large subunit-like protein